MKKNYLRSLNFTYKNFQYHTYNKTYNLLNKNKLFSSQESGSLNRKTSSFSSFFKIPFCFTFRDDPLNFDPLLLRQSLSLVNDSLSSRWYLSLVNLLRRFNSMFLQLFFLRLRARFAKNSSGVMVEGMNDFLLPFVNFITNFVYVEKISF